MRGRLAALAAALLWVAACSDRSPGSPSGTLDGPWAGTVVEAGLGTGQARLVLNQSGGVLSGTFTTTAGGVVGRNGAVHGVVNGSVVTLTFTPPAPLDCGAGVTLSGTLALTLTAGGQKLTGSFAGFSCGGAVTGTLELSPE